MTKQSHLAKEIEIGKTRSKIFFLNCRQILASVAFHDQVNFII